MMNEFVNDAAMQADTIAADWHAITNNYNICTTTCTQNPSHHRRGGGSSDSHRVLWSSKVACSLAFQIGFHRPASQGRCNCTSSSGLSAGNDPTIVLVSHPHEWESRGVEVREVMSSHEATPVTKTSHARDLCAKLLKVHVSSQDTSPSG